MTNQEIVEILKERLYSLKTPSAKKYSLIGLRDGLYTLAEVQADVSIPVPGCIPDPSTLPTKDNIRTYGLAMMIEMGEFIQEFDWKPWKNKGGIDRDRIVDEFADILAFQGILIYYMTLYGISPEDLAEGYRKKSIVNIERFLGKHGSAYQQTLPGLEENKNEND